MSSPSSLLLKNGTCLIHDDNDHVVSHPNTDILVKGDTIAEIGSNISPPEDAQVIDCKGKIVTPGFVDTHHHLWQTQLKGRHADEQLLEYMGSGNMQSYNYQPADSFWGQLSGCLEAIDAGTTTVLDHSHGSYTQQHADAILSATVSSGLRCVLAYAPIMRLTNWNEKECVPSQDLTLSWLLDYLESRLQKSKEPIAGTVYLGLGFDLFFLPKDFVSSVFQRMRKAGVKLITIHVGRNAVLGPTSTTKLLDDYGLLGSDIVVSHATGTEDDEKKILWEKGVYVSSTPETECQMAMGWPIALHPNVHGSLGVDCHTNNSSSIIAQARMLLQMARQETAITLVSQQPPLYPRTIRGSTEKAFNLATVEGARALGLGNEVGSIKTGKKADLVVWEWEESVGMLGTGTRTGTGKGGDDGALVAVLRHSDLRDVHTVLIDGKIRKQDGKLCSVVDVDADIDVDTDGDIAGDVSGGFDLGDIQQKNTNTNKDKDKDKDNNSKSGGALSWPDIAKNLRQSRTQVLGRADRCSLPRMREMLVGMFGVDDGKLVDVD